MRVCEWLRFALGLRRMAELAPAKDCRMFCCIAGMHCIMCTDWGSGLNTGLAKQPGCSRTSMQLVVELHGQVQEPGCLHAAC